VTSPRLSSSNDKKTVKKKILFVDNERDMTTMPKMALGRAGFTVDIFNDPLLALKNFKPNLYDLALLDVMMPEMGGIELYKQLKKIDPGIKVCFLTASSEMYHEDLGKERHCHLNKDLFLHMPLPIKGIIEELKKRIDSP
jgi:CheY-like chemotaxis protein